MMRKNLSIALAVTLFGLAGTAQAQGYATPFGSKYQVAFGAERLFGFHWVNNNWQNPDNTRGSASGTSVGFGWQFAQHMQFNQPRLGIDFFVVQDISIGGAIGAFSRSGRAGSDDGFIFSPRVGFNVPLSQVVTFWPRLGLTFIAVGDDHAFGFSGEANFAFFPHASSGWAVLLTPSMDLAPFGGTDRGNGPNTDFSAYSFGVSVGILGVI
jgi:hypothetical protein